MEYPVSTLELVKEKILSNVIVDPETGCWIWQKAKTKFGYGVMGVPGYRKTEETHLLAYKAWVGPVLPENNVDHERCDNPPCCNYDHLVQKTPWENLSRSKINPFAVKARQDRCINDHLFDAENTLIHPTRGTRSCRQCKRDRDREIYAKRVGRSVRACKRKTPSGTETALESLLMAPEALSSASLWNSGVVSYGR